MQETKIEINENNLQEVYEFNKIAKQASGSVMYRQGNAVLIAAVAIDEKQVDEDFLPLTVQYMERAYASAKIPGGFIKRETKPGDFETLTSRIIDRSLRPLFPKGFHYPVTISVMVVSADSSVDMQIAGLHAANAALFVSDIPVSQSIAAVRVGTIEDDIIINPTLKEQQNSELDLLIVGSGEDVVMIEMRTIATEKEGLQSANEFSDEALIDVIEMASKAINKSTLAYIEHFTPLARTPLLLSLEEKHIDEELYTYIEKNYAMDVEKAVAHMAKSERSSELKKIRELILEALEKEEKDADKALVSQVLEIYKKTVVRSMILDKNIRADGRELDEVRPISIETNILPSVHGSCLFTRGQTQALVTLTLGDKKDAQMYDLITEKNALSENFMVHYNFPGYSVGEAKFIGAPGRRELGHGNLGKRALEPSLPLNYDGTIRLVSEILESNGSSSMATICGGSLALKAAQIETTELVAGIAMGLVMEENKYAILTDIMGLEDHDGDMDFKVAGTDNGITALQMDIKLGGIDLSILKEALNKATKGKKHILTLMEESSLLIKESTSLPSTEYFKVHPSKIVEIIGKAGATIRDIIEKFEVTIDLERESGGVKISGSDKEQVEKAKAHIKNISSSEVKKKMIYKLGEKYEGKVKRIVDFGLFIEMPDGNDALLHISKVAKERVNNLPERYKEGDILTVVVMEQKGHKVELATEAFLS